MHVNVKVEEVEPGRAVHRRRGGALQRQRDAARRCLYLAHRHRAGALGLVAGGLEDGNDADERAFPRAVREGCITCKKQVLHKTRRTATAEARVYDGEGGLVAMGTGAFRIFEKRGAPVV